MFCRECTIRFNQYSPATTSGGAAAGYGASEQRGSSTLPDADAATACPLEGVAIADGDAAHHATGLVNVETARTTRPVGTPLDGAVLKHGNGAQPGPVSPECQPTRTLVAGSVAGMTVAYREVATVKAAGHLMNRASSSFAAIQYCIQEGIIRACHSPEDPSCG